jgi:hypothetical protein
MQRVTPIQTIKSVKIGSRVFTVIVKEDLISREKDTVLWGEFRNDMQEIRIEEKVAPFLHISTLWHEIVHAIITHADHKHDEQVVTTLGYGLAAVCADNPGLIRAMLETLKAHE